ncbi:MAG TPA: inorganic diphosphatase [Caldithrix sp.]|nr:inorganic diphosphatase [Caldithrix sp.]
MAHLWHGIQTGVNPPEDINVLIEIPSGSKCKYELDKIAGIIRVDRIIASAVYYPGNYGFIPQTLAEDGDPLDALVLSQISFHPGVVVRSRPIGVMRMTDAGEPDDKILCVPLRDPHYSQIKTAHDLPGNMLDEIQEFFRVYKNLEEKEVIIRGFESLELAVKLIKESISAYKKKYIAV